jgi:hypothetical protein
MKRVVFNLSAVLMAVMLAACSHSPPHPDWLSGDTARYDSDRYLLGRGEAPTLEQAKDRARSDVAKIFEVAVNESSEDVRSAESRDQGGARQSGSDARVSRTLTTHTDQVLEGVRIAETWHDPQNGDYYALAVLSRSQAAASLRQEITQLDEATRRYLDQSRAAGDLLDKIAAARRALETQQARESYQNTLKVVDRSGQGIPAEWNTARLRADLRDLQARLKVAVQVPPDAPPALSAIVAGALAEGGYVTVEEPKADFVLAVQTTLNEPNFREGWYWVTGDVQAQLRSADGRVRGTRSWPVKASAQDAMMARQRAWDEVNALLKQQLVGGLALFAEQ